MKKKCFHLAEQEFILYFLCNVRVSEELIKVVVVMYNMRLQFDII